MNVLSLSYGKDSMACLGACDELGWKIDRIIHAEVWATDTVSADLPPMVEFKKKADKIIKERWGIEVEHIQGEFRGMPATYDRIFYTEVGEKRYEARKKLVGRGCNIRLNKWYGFPMLRGAWCNGYLKMSAIKKAQKLTKDCMQIVGIAADEPIRIERQRKKEASLLPLVELGWTEADCRKWCEDNDLLSPIYSDSSRGGCWFCHNQGLEQLRKLRHNYPEYWKMMLKWDDDSCATFRPDGHTIHDYDRRFQAEDDGFIDPQERFRWQDLEMQEFTITHYLKDNGVDLTIEPNWRKQ